VLRAAIGNAQDPEQNKEQKKGRSIAIDQLVVTDVRVDGGPMFKRMRPRARGMAFMVLRRTSHVHVTVEDINEI